MEHITTLLQKARRQAGLTQKEAAALIGCPQQSISAAECTGKSPSIRMLQQMARVYGVTWMIGDEINFVRRN